MKLQIQQLKLLIKNSRLDYRKKNIIGLCPKCGYNEFGISIEENHVFGCYRKKKCGWSGNIFVLLKELGKLNEYIDEGFSYSNSLDKIEKRIEILDSKTVNLELEEIGLPLGWKRVYYHTYLEGRGFTEEDYYIYEVGVTKLHPKLRDYYVVFLLRSKGKLVGYIGRHIWDKRKIEEENKKREKKILRYCNSTSNFSCILEGIDEVTEKTEIIILVEGLLDRVNINRLLNLNSQEEVKCCNTWKCEISNEQIILLQNFTNIKKVIILYDPDVISEIQKAGLVLENKFQEVEIGFIENNKDPGELNVLELEKTLSQLYTVQEFIQKKINKKQLKI